jgi:hypothetical protein
MLMPMKNNILVLGLIAVMAWTCNNSEGLPSEDGSIPRNMPGPHNIDSMHRYPPVHDVDSMIDPRTGQPKTGETDTI